ncbi:hypothetical protein KCU60_g18, partial [Aureobasidium melanogenum]
MTRSLLILFKRRLQRFRETVSRRRLLLVAGSVFALVIARRGCLVMDHGQRCVLYRVTLSSDRSYVDGINVEVPQHLFCQDFETLRPQTPCRAEHAELMAIVVVEVADGGRTHNLAARRCEGSLGLDADVDEVLTAPGARKFVFMVLGELGRRTRRAGSRG